MREFKFRQFINGRFHFASLEIGRHIGFPSVTHEIEQFTGLLDKNGNEIYEGDIVLAKDHEPDHYRIEFREGGFCGVWGEGDDEWYPVDINHFYDSTGCCIEVIGNIHQA